MDKKEIIKNIALRTKGDIYLGVVGAVRTGKSTFIKRMVETLIVPNIPDEYLPDFKLVVSKAIVPSQEELEHNPRARSSKLRVIERVK